jgi:D-amino peptidase
MKVYISCDMEGVAGVVNWDHVDRRHPEYARFRRLMTEEINVAVEGALQGEATDVVVNDSHGGMTNVLIEGLHPSARLVSGSPKPWGMMEAIGTGYRCAFFLGYHGMADSRATLGHTFTSARVYSIRINEQPAGELALNAYLAGFHGVPVTLVSGDDAICREARELIPEVVTVETKQTLGYMSALSNPVEECRDQLRNMGRLAVQSPCPVLEPPSSAVFTVQFIRSAFADLAAMIPGVERKGAREIMITGSDYAEAYRLLLVAVRFSAYGG